MTRLERIILGLAQLAAAAAVLFLVATAHAQDEGVWLPRAEAAHLFSLAAEAPRLAEKIAELEKAVATERARADALEKLVALERQLLERQERLTVLADEERDVYRARADRLEKDSGKGRRWSNAMAFSGWGAALGTVVMPGIGTGVGALVGGLAGLLAP